MLWIGIHLFVFAFTMHRVVAMQFLLPIPSCSCKGTCFPTGSYYILAVLIFVILFLPRMGWNFCLSFQVFIAAVIWWHFYSLLLLFPSRLVLCSHVRSQLLVTLSEFTPFYQIYLRLRKFKLLHDSSMAFPVCSWVLGSQRRRQLYLRGILLSVV
ncbi:hypothetical protein BDY19DRAFT_484311 [Irpex rosettiformis]|uniref:Uncharacterized protein n=1 Tax=Irpex rosettiformis TaxID=378272 RepID=A0ACB8UDM9_9APHY|nr:hypothetical protein BDY19DRAFT_484311 [Irpex rosettiformis]